MSEHDWLEPINRRIEQVREETAAIKKETARLQAWKEYCEASLDLSNQDDAGGDTPWLECTDGFKDLPYEDADLIDSGSRVG